jgi:hypothetical protein
MTDDNLASGCCGAPVDVEFQLHRNFTAEARFRCVRCGKTARTAVRSAPLTARTEEATA